MSDEAHRVSGGLSRSEVLRSSPSLFQTHSLDRLTRIHPAVPVLIFGPAIALVGFLGFRRLSLGGAVLAVAGGYAFWTLIEYWFHRAVFHFEPEHGIGARVHWMIHGVHHDHPNDPKRLVLPPAFSIPLAAAFLGLFVVVLGTPLAWPVCAGFFAGYLGYDMIHFGLHHHRPKSRIGKRLREHHMRHHFEDDTRGFGVSAPWWDIVFRTAPRRRGEAAATPRGKNPRVA